MSQIHSFSQSGCTNDKSIWERTGRRGQRALELAEMGMPVVPGFILDATVTAKIDSVDVAALVRVGLPAIESGIGRNYGDPENPLLLKVVCSSNLSLPLYPTVFNVGLSPATIPGFTNIIGEEAAWFEYCYLLRSAATKLFDLPDDEVDKIFNSHERTVEGNMARAEALLNLIGRDKIPDDPYEQLIAIVKSMAARYNDPDLDEDDNIAIMVQGIVFGNLGEDSSVGMYYTRDIITGEDQLQGSFLKNSYTLEKEGEPIASLDGSYLDQLREIGRKLESHFHEIREVKFIVEKQRLWLINQTPVDGKSTQSHVRTLLDLLKGGEIEEKWLIQQIPPGQLATLLHPVVDQGSLHGMTTVSGGMAGSPGAAVGRVYFSADRLMEAHRDAVHQGEDSRVILCVTSSYAEDVKAIEIGEGVISVEGGYSSHAPVVARSLGKVSILNQNIRVDGKSFTLEGCTVNEGDWITLDVPVYKDPTVTIGKARLISPDINTSGLVEFIEVVRRHINDDFVVRANADLGRDAAVALKMGAYGIGLCRTEHMFFQEDRINRFREMILANTFEERAKAIADLLPLQRNDFYDLFHTMAPYPVTIRLLDAPLHEFLPRNEEILGEYYKYLEGKGVTPDRKETAAVIERLHEFNPMLGHRGCRVGITYPEIYEMQVRAIFEAACRLKKEDVTVVPEIMIPLVMNPAELSYIRNGKKIEGKYIKGIRDIADEVFSEQGVSIDYQVGTMVELPAAAISSDELARYAQFFSYGTNDLTQTTMGLSRDDVNSFFPSYTEFDLLADNPFQVLVEPVKTLVQISAHRGRMVRPDIKLGLCGEHGADPANIAFCRDTGLNYVSCSPYSVPIALLAVAQLNLKRAEES